MPINVDAWEDEISQMLAKYEVFRLTRLVLDTKRQHDDELVFMITDFTEAVPDGLWDDVRQYALQLRVNIESDPNSHRRENIVFTVREPSANVLANLQHYAQSHLSVLKNRTYSPLVIWTCLLLSVLWVGWAASLLHEHWHDTAEPWEGLVHGLVAALAYLWPF